MNASDEIVVWPEHVTTTPLPLVPETEGVVSAWPTIEQLEACAHGLDWNAWHEYAEAVSELCPALGAYEELHAEAADGHSPGVAGWPRHTADDAETLRSEGIRPDDTAAAEALWHARHPEARPDTPAGAVSNARWYHTGVPGPAADCCSECGRAGRILDGHDARAYEPCVEEPCPAEAAIWAAGSLAVSSELGNGGVWGLLAYCTPVVAAERGWEEVTS